jgi:hypothetical protein
MSELDWIVMKCLDKDRNRRYETANGLAHDIERYRNDEAVQACPPSVWYRLRKFGRRYKAAFTAAALVLVALVLGTAISTWQAIEATQARDSERRARKAERQAQGALNAAREEKEQQRTRTNRKLSAALVDAARLREKARTARPGDPEPGRQLRASLPRAEALAGSDLADPVLVRRVKVLLEELKQAEADRRMAARLEAIRFIKQDKRPLAYKKAFRSYGLPILTMKVADAARRIAASSIRDQLVPALDDWAGYDQALCSRLLPMVLMVMPQGLDVGSQLSKVVGAAGGGTRVQGQLLFAPVVGEAAPASGLVINRA